MADAMQQLCLENMMLNISKYVRLRNNTVSVNGTNHYSADTDEPFKDFIKSCYKHFGCDYSKFYKMDKLSKLGFVASEILLADTGIKSYKDSDVSIVLANASSSLNNDRDYQQTIESLPSPAVFVYTLPNIVIGEICIRNNFKGETNFFVQETFDASLMVDYVSSIASMSSDPAFIVGWVEIDMNDNYDALLLLVENSNGLFEFDHIELQKLYNN